MECSNNKYIFTQLGEEKQKLLATIDDLQTQIKNNDLQAKSQQSYNNQLNK